jgi:hypothetical protein
VGGEIYNQSRKNEFSEPHGRGRRSLEPDGGAGDNLQLLPQENALDNDAARGTRAEEPGDRRQQISKQDEQSPHSGERLEQNALWDKLAESLIFSHKLEFARHTSPYGRPRPR